MMRGQAMLGFATLAAILIQPGVSRERSVGPSNGLSVNVVNAPTQPVPVSIQNPEAFLYQANGNDSRNDSNNLFAVLEAEVPFGFRLVIEDVSGECFVSDTGGDLATVRYCSVFVSDNGGLVVERFIPMSGPPVASTLADLTPAQSQVFSGPLVAYADEGNRVAVRCQLDKSVEGSGLNVSIAGHLYPVQ